MEVRCPAESLSLLYLNPPYDWEAGSSNNQRLELVFLEHTYRWLKPTGVLVFVIPQIRLAKCARLLSEQFTDLQVFGLTEPVCVRFKQVVLLASRRKATCPTFRRGIAGAYAIPGKSGDAARPSFFERHTRGQVRGPEFRANRVDPCWDSFG